MRNDTQEPSVWVRRRWNDPWKARYSVDNVRNVHWGRLSPGALALPQPFLHGYVWFHEMVESDPAQSGTHEPCPYSGTDACCAYDRTAWSCPWSRTQALCPHSVEVCIVKKDNDPEVFRLLLEQAGPKPKRRS